MVATRAITHFLRLRLRHLEGKPALAQRGIKDNCPRVFSFVSLPFLFFQFYAFMASSVSLPPRMCGLSGCKAFLAGDDIHAACIACLGVLHAHEALAGIAVPSCEVCDRFSQRVLAERYQAALTLAGRASGGAPAMDCRARGASAAAWDPRPSRSPFPPGAAEPPPHGAAAAADLRPRAEQRGGSSQPRPLVDEGDDSPPMDVDDEDDGEESDDVDYGYDDDDMPTVPEALLASREEDVAPRKEPVPISVAWEGAILNCGLALPVEERAAAPSVLEGFLAFDALPPPPLKTRKLPVAPGFREALHSSWSSHIDPARLPFVTEVVGAAEMGFSAVPTMDPVFAASIADQNDRGAVNLHPKPTFGEPKQKAASIAVEKTYKSAAMVARTLNAATLMQGSLCARLKKLGPALGEEAEVILREMQIAIQLNCHATQWAGRAMANAAACERARWLDLARFQHEAPRDARKHLMGLQLTPDNLFQGAAAYLKTTTEEEKARKEAASGVLADPLPPAARPRTDRPGDRGRTSSRRPRASRTASSTRSTPAVSRERPREEQSSRSSASRPPPPPAAKNQRRDADKSRRGRGK